MVLAACTKASSAEHPVSSSTAAASARAASSSTSTAAVTPTAPPMCLPRWTSDESLVHVEANGDRGVFCYGDDFAREAPCVEVELATGAVVGTRTQTLASPTRGVVDPKGIAATSADGTRAFAFVTQKRPGTPIPWRLYGDVLDGKTSKQLAHHPLTSTLAFTSDENAYSARFVGKNLLLGDYMADGSNGITVLMNATTGRVEPVWIGHGTFTLVRNNLWAAANGRHLAFWDVETLQSIGSGIDAPDRKDLDVHAAAIAVRTTDLVFGYGGPPGYLLVDLATKKAGAPRLLPVCP